MSWSDAITSSAKFRAAEAAPVHATTYLPMNLNAAEALEEWSAFWFRVTDPSHTAGEARQLSAYRERFERLRAQEETGAPAQPVALPARPVADRPTHFAHEAAVMREGKHMASNEKAAMLLTRLRNKRDRERNGELSDAGGKP